MGLFYSVKNERLSWSGKLVTHNALRLLELIGVMPKGTSEVGETLNIAGDALVKGHQTKVCRVDIPPLTVLIF